MASESFTRIDSSPNKCSKRLAGNMEMMPISLCEMLPSLPLPACFTCYSHHCQFNDCLSNTEISIWEYSRSDIFHSVRYLPITQKLTINMNDEYANKRNAHHKYLNVLANQHHQILTALRDAIWSIYYCWLLLCRLSDAPDAIRV